MTNQYQIEVKIVGADITPEKISSRDIGELIASVEQMIASVVARDNPALQVDERDVVVGLAAIQSGSYVLQFRTVYDTEVAKAYATISQSIVSGNYSKLPRKSIDAIKDIRKISRKYRTSTELWETNGHHTQLATVSQNTAINLENPFATNRTTLYGTVISVGGEEPPRARLKLLDGTYLYCNITRREQLRIARQLGERLYQRVGVQGVARWDVFDMTIQYFLIERVTEYTRKSMQQAIASLYDIAGKYYENVGDIDALVADMRGTDGEL
jgi:hypothetical protein